MPRFVGNPASRLKEFDPLPPFIMGQVHVPRKGMKMCGKALHDLAHAWVGVSTEIFHEDVSDVVGGDVAHCKSPVPCRVADLCRQPVSRLGKPVAASQH